MTELTAQDIKNIVDSCFLTLGVYPLSVTKDGVTTPRTEWQTGYNEGVSEVMKKIHEGIRYFEVGDKADLLRLMREDLGWWDGERFVLNMNDQFAWGCADCEEVEPKDYKEVLRLYDAYGNDGPLYWVAEKRGYDPNKDDSEGHLRNWEAVATIRRQEKNE